MKDDSMLSIDQFKLQMRYIKGKVIDLTTKEVVLLLNNKAREKNLQVQTQLFTQLPDN